MSQQQYGWSRAIPDALAFEYKRDYGCASGQLELADLVNYPPIAREFRRFSLSLPEQTLSLVLGDLRSFSDDSADPIGGRRLIVSNGAGAPAEFTSHVVATVEEIIGPVVESYGSIEGRLQGLETHGRRRFYIWESLSGQRVRCYFDDSLDLEELLEGYEKRVSTSGLIRSRPSGRRISIEVKEFSILSSDDSLQPSDEILRRWETARCVFGPRITRK